MRRPITCERGIACRSCGRGARRRLDRPRRYTGGGGYHCGAAGGDGHWAAGANGHGATGTTARRQWRALCHELARRHGEAQNGSWSATTANGHSNSGTYGTTAYGTHYATGSYGGAVATNNGHWAAEDNGNYAYGTHYYGAATYAGAYHPPAVVNQYYATGCYNCGGWSAAGAAAAGAVAGVAVGAAIGAARPRRRQSLPSRRPTPSARLCRLPPGCVYAPVGGRAYYACNGVWFTPITARTVLYYAIVPAPT